MAHSLHDDGDDGALGPTGLRFLVGTFFFLDIGGGANLALCHDVRRQRACFFLLVGWFSFARPEMMLYDAIQRSKLRQ